MLIYSILPDSKVKLCNLSLGYRVWWRWLCCRVCCNLYWFAGLTLEGKFIRSLEQHQQQLASLKSELDEQKEAREKAEKLFVKTCKELESEAKSLKTTIERLQCSHGPAVRIRNVRSVPMLFLLPLAPCIPGSRPAPRASRQCRPALRPLRIRPTASIWRARLHLNGRGGPHPAVHHRPPQLADIFAVARFRYLLGGLLHRPGPIRP